jgi:hypothetical protein
MTSLVSSNAKASPARGAMPHAPAILCALLIGLLLSWARVTDVWTTGAFDDPDDAMRLVQIRDLLNGQGWFDLTAYRLAPPAGVFSHWSRIVDVPMALLIKTFELGLPQILAERAARLAFPLLLQACLLFALARLATLLMGPRAATPAIVLGLLGGIVFGQFRPGRIDHHSLQIVLLVASLGCLVASLSPRRTREAMLAAGFASLSLAISLENLPFILVFVAALGSLWIIRGAEEAAPMRAFALGLGMTLPLCFVATIGPSRWTVAVPDAFSATHLVAGLGGALVLGVLSIQSGKLDSIWRRLAYAAIGASLVLGTTMLFAPGGLHEPFAGVDPVVRALWLTNVGEVFTFARMCRETPLAAAIFAGPLVLCSAGVVAACLHTQGIARLRWLFVGATLLVAILLSLFAVRVLTFAGPLATVGGVAAILYAHDRSIAAGRPLLAALSLAAIVPLSTTGWALASSFVAPADQIRQGKGLCLVPSAFAPLAALPSGLVLAPIDLGAHMLAFTPHSVVAAPYHRNNVGNRLSLDVFLAAPDDAKAIFAASGARYLVTCKGMSDIGVLRTQTPHGLAVALADGLIPSWLHAVPLRDTPLQVFEAATVTDP